MSQRNVESLARAPMSAAPTPAPVGRPPEADGGAFVTRAAVWQPWTPHVGDRVRVILSPECPLPSKPEPMAGEVVEHWPVQDGQEGTVIAVDDGTFPHSPPGHPYLVSLPPIEHAHCSSGAGYFAAVELVPVDGDAQCGEGETS